MFSAIPGIDNQITEMDISVYNNGTQIYQEVPPEVLFKQGRRYRDMFDAFRQLTGKISSVTLWGQADDHTWLSTFPITRLEAPLLFNDLLQAKPAYWGIVDPQQLMCRYRAGLPRPAGLAFEMRLSASSIPRAYAARRPRVRSEFTHLEMFRRETLILLASRRNAIASRRGVC